MLAGRLLRNQARDDTAIVRRDNVGEILLANLHAGIDDADQQEVAVFTVCRRQVRADAVPLAKQRVARCARFFKQFVPLPRPAAGRSQIIRNAADIGQFFLRRPRTNVAPTLADLGVEVRRRCKAPRDAARQSECRLRESRRASILASSLRTQSGRPNKIPLATVRTGTLILG